MRTKPLFYSGAVLFIALALCIPQSIEVIPKGPSSQDWASGLTVRREPIALAFFHLLGNRPGSYPQIRLISNNFVLDLDKRAIPTADAGNKQRDFFFLLSPVDIQEWRARVNAYDHPPIEIRLPQRPPIEAFYRVKREYKNNGFVVDWFGESADGQQVQLTLILPTYLVLTVASAKEVVSVIPSVSKGANHRLVIPSGLGTSHPNLLGDEQMAITPCDEDYKGEMTQNNTPSVNIDVGKVGGFATDDAVTKVIFETDQLRVLNDALRRANANFHGSMRFFDSLLLGSEQDINAFGKQAFCSVPAPNIEAIEGGESLQPIEFKGDKVYESLIGRINSEPPSIVALIVNLTDMRQCLPAIQAARKTCGAAFLLRGAPHGGLILLNKDCVFGHGLFAHEAGHIFGAQHELQDYRFGDRYHHATQAWPDYRQHVKRVNKSCVFYAGGFLKDLVPLCPDIETLEVGTLDSSGDITRRISAFSQPGLQCNGADLVFVDGKANSAAIVKEWGVQNFPLAVASGVPVGRAPPPATTFSGALPKVLAQDGVRSNSSHNAATVEAGASSPLQHAIPAPIESKRLPASTPVATQDGLRQGRSISSERYCSPLEEGGEQSCAAADGESSVIFFQRNSAKPAVNSSLDKVVGRAAEANGQVTVLGFGSSSGSYERNLVLSSERARFVANRILRASGKRASLRVAVCSYGKAFAHCFERSGPESKAMRVQVLISDSKSP